MLVSMGENPSLFRAKWRFSHHIKLMPVILRMRRKNLKFFCKRVLLLYNISVAIQAVLPYRLNGQIKENRSGETG